jgi:acetoin utilization deacetylase AcuC-like enzyme
MIETLLLTDDRMLDHDAGPSHAERPDRLRAIHAELRRAPIAQVEWRTPQSASSEAVSRVHTSRYVQFIESLRGRTGALDPDTVVSPGSVPTAFLAAGAAIDAVTAVVRGEARRSFALVRPPGHHAEPDRAMGFCLFNNIAIAAEHARSELGCQRVLIVDWDVHHGNGTQNAFEDRRDVLVFNTHRYPFYPGTGAATETGTGEGKGFTVNVPLPAELGDADYAAIFREMLVPVAETYRPDLILVSAGFDPHRDDPIGDMKVTEDGFAHLCGVVKDVADAVCGGKLALILEGGYDLQGLAKSVRGCVEVLAGATPPTPSGSALRGEQALREAIKAQQAYWPV